MRRSLSVGLPALAAVIAATLVLSIYKGRDKEAQTLPPPPPAVEVSATNSGSSALPAPPARPPVPPSPSAIAKPTGRPLALTDSPGKPPAAPPPMREGMSPPQLPDNLPDPEELREQFVMLRRFLELPPERLARIRESIERIERMPPERKNMMLARLQNVDPTSSGGPSRSRSPLADAPVEIRAQIGKLIDSMPADVRNALMEKLRGFSPEQRAAYFEGMAQVLSVGSAQEQPATPWKAQPEGGIFAK